MDLKRLVVNVAGSESNGHEIYDEEMLYKNDLIDALKKERDILDKNFDNMEKDFKEHGYPTEESPVWTKNIHERNLLNQMIEQLEVLE